MPTDIFSTSARSTFAPGLEFRDDGSFKPEPYRRTPVAGYPTEIHGARMSDWATGWMRDVVHRPGEGLKSQRLAKFPTRMPGSLGSDWESDGMKGEGSCCGSCAAGGECEGGGSKGCGCETSSEKPCCGSCAEGLPCEGGSNTGLEATFSARASMTEGQRLSFARSESLNVGWARDPGAGEFLKVGGVGAGVGLGWPGWAGELDPQVPNWWDRLMARVFKFLGIKLCPCDDQFKAAQECLDGTPDAFLKLIGFVPGCASEVAAYTACLKKEKKRDPKLQCPPLIFHKGLTVRRRWPAFSEPWWGVVHCTGHCVGTRILHPWIMVYLGALFEAVERPMGATLGWPPDAVSVEERVRDVLIYNSLGTHWCGPLTAKMPVLKAIDACRQCCAASVSLWETGPG